MVIMYINVITYAEDLQTCTARQRTYRRAQHIKLKWQDKTKDPNDC